MLPIALDAMGGDHAPDEIVRGALLAVAEYGCDILLVGPELTIAAQLTAEGASPQAREHIEIVDAPTVIAMEEHPAHAVREKKDSSLVRTCTLVAEGKASAAVSAGNSGAMLASGLLVNKRIHGVSRPAIGALFPSRSGYTFVIDAGANTDCKPEWLAQFAIMGSVYARSMMGIAQPRIALLSNGSEATKGSQLVQDAHALLLSAPVNFIGNVEGKDLLTGSCDVVVCDGFTGNVVLKAAEGVGEFLFASMKDAAMSSLRAKVGGALLKPKLRGIRDSVDYRLTGGALLLGVKSELVIAHGRSDALAIKNAIRVGREAAAADVSGTLAREIAASSDVSVSARNMTPSGISDDRGIVQ